MIRNGLTIVQGKNSPMQEVNAYEAANGLVDETSQPKQAKG